MHFYTSITRLVIFSHVKKDINMWLEKAKYCGNYLINLLLLGLNKEKTQFC